MAQNTIFIKNVLEKLTNYKLVWSRDILDMENTSLGGSLGRKYSSLGPKVSQNIYLIKKRPWKLSHQWKLYIWMAAHYQAEYVGIINMTKYEIVLNSVFWDPKRPKR